MPSFANDLEDGRPDGGREVEVQVDDEPGQEDQSQPGGDETKSNDVPPTLASEDGSFLIRWAGLVHDGHEGSGEGRVRIRRLRCR